MDAGLRHIEHPFAAGWFDAWLRVFVLGVIGGIAVLALGPVAPMKLIGGVTCVSGMLGALMCAIGLRLYHPARWRELAAHVSSVGDSLRGATEAIGEPRSAAYARAAAPLDAQRPGI
jgi:hypothetical protein